jgi:hypothetical protein
MIINLDQVSVEPPLLFIGYPFTAEVKGKRKYFILNGVKYESESFLVKEKIDQTHLHTKRFTLQPLIITERHKNISEERNNIIFKLKNQCYQRQKVT